MSRYLFHGICINIFVIAIARFADMIYNHLYTSSLEYPERSELGPCLFPLLFSTFSSLCSFSCLSVSLFFVCEKPPFIASLLLISGSFSEERERDRGKTLSLFSSLFFFLSLFFSCLGKYIRRAHWISGRSPQFFISIFQRIYSSFTHLLVVLPGLDPTGILIIKPK